MLDVNNSRVDAISISLDLFLPVMDSSALIFAASAFFFIDNGWHPARVPSAFVFAHRESGSWKWWH
jgi:hypothetical protein